MKNSFKFKKWMDGLISNGINPSNIEELSTIYRDNGEVLFSMLKGKFETPEGVDIPPCVVLRGHFVCILPIIKEVESGNEYLLMVKQRRIADGSYLYELPAGMCDEDNDPYNVAIKEMLEETGFEVSKEDLNLLNREVLFTSPGLLDEGGYFFWTKIEMNEKEIEEIKGKKCGLVEENEDIELYLFTLEEGLEITRNIIAKMLILWYNHIK